MVNQISTDHIVQTFVLQGNPIESQFEVILQDAGRTTDLEIYTVMAQIAATEKWVPLTDIAATDGTAYPLGILYSPTVPAADIVAGDVANQIILVGGEIIVNEGLLVFENSLDLTTVIGAGTIHARTIKMALADIGIRTKETEQVHSTL